MKVGAVAILDALGFKGIWKREEPQSVLEKLSTLRDVVVSDISLADKSFPRMVGVEQITRQAAFLSDSLVIAVSVDPGGVGLLGPVPHAVGGFPDVVRQEHSLRDLLVTLASLLEESVATVPRLAYRGTIACGEFEFEDVFVLGEAIDEAAELASAADGAFVWLAPSANAVHNAVSQFDPFAKQVDCLAPIYPVPMKDGTELETRVLYPLSQKEPQERAAILYSLLSTFVSTSEDVQRKKTNTEAFLLSFVQHPSAKTVLKRLMPPPPRSKS